MFPKLRVPALALLVLTVPVLASASITGNDGNEAKVAVMSSRSSALVNVSITSFRKIGKVLIEVKDKDGRTLYQERGKALTEELVRRLDKNVFPKGELTLSVTARDFAITQVFTVE